MMLAKLRRWRPTHATAVAYLALFVALGGTSYAVATIDSPDVIDESLRSEDLRNDLAVRTEDINDNDVKGDDVDEESLGKVPTAELGDFSFGAGFAFFADKLDNKDADDFLSSRIRVRSETFNVAANGSSFRSQACPDDHIAVGGGIGFGGTLDSGDVVTASQPDGGNPPTGWSAGIENGSTTASKEATLTVICVKDESASGN